MSKPQACFAKGLEVDFQLLKLFFEISPDPLIQAPGNLQSYNRYSYVMNRPLSLTDPSGFAAFGVMRRAAFGAYQNLSESISTVALSAYDHVAGVLVEKTKWIVEYWKDQETGEEHVDVYLETMLIYIPSSNISKNTAPANIIYNDPNYVAPHVYEEPTTRSYPCFERSTGNEIPLDWNAMKAEHQMRSKRSMEKGMFLLGSSFNAYYDIGNTVADDVAIDYATALPAIVAGEYIWGKGAKVLRVLKRAPKTTQFAKGSFSITEAGFKGYPKGVSRPRSPFRLD